MIVSALFALVLSGVAQAAPAPAAPEHPPIPLAGQAETLRRYDAHASQGVAVGPNDVYAVSNFTLARFDKITGEKKAEWVGERSRYPHINSCTLIAVERVPQLVCASSNYPAVPHVSTVEFFDPVDLHHIRSVALGLGTGSVTWVDGAVGAVDMRAPGSGCLVA